MYYTSYAEYTDYLTSYARCFIPGANIKNETSTSKYLMVLFFC